MMNVFKPSPPLATQLQTMVNFAGCTNVVSVWSTVRGQVLTPNKLEIQWSSERAMAGASLAEFKSSVISDVRPALDRGVMKLFRGMPNVRRIDRAGFADPEHISELATAAMKGGVISATPAIIMLGSAAQMLGAGSSPLTRRFKIFEMAAITFLTGFGDYMLYNADGLGPFINARYPAMAVMTVACLYYLVRSTINIIKYT